MRGRKVGSLEARSIKELVSRFSDHRGANLYLLFFFPSRYNEAQTFCKLGGGSYSCPFLSAECMKTNASIVFAHKPVSFFYS